MSNDISTGCQNKCQMILVHMYNIFRLLIGVPDYSISSESCGGKQKNVENDGHLNKKQLPGIEVPTITI